MKKILYLIFASLVFASCSSNKTVNIESLAGFSFNEVTNKGLNGTIELNVDNEFSKIQISDAEIAIFTADSKSPLITILATDKIVIPKGNSKVALPLDLEIKGGIFGSIMIKNVLKNKAKSLNVSFKGKVKKGLVSKYFDMQNVPLEEFSNIFSIDKELINGLFNKF
ncbi:MAG: hypothetical protein R3Y51_06585 [Rikenellaceae bacterium]